LLSIKAINVLNVPVVYQGGKSSHSESLFLFIKLFSICCFLFQFMNKDHRTKHLNEKTTFHLSVLQKDYLDMKTRTETQAIAPRSRSPVMTYPEGQKDKMMKDFLVKIDALMQDNVSMRRKLAEQTTQLLHMERRLASASQVEMSSAVNSKAPTDKESKELLKDLRKRTTNVENNVAQFQVYHIDNIRRTNEQGETVAEVKRMVEDAVESQRGLETRIHAQETVTTMSNVALADLEENLRELKLITYDGILVWKITDVARKRTEAVTGRVASFYSQQFYSSRQGYRMCARIYLNGDGMGRGNCISLFFVIMRGEYDALVRWPFRQKVTLMLLDQDNIEHVIDAFRPDPSSSSFQRPRGEMNIASGCPMFCPLAELDKHAYIRDDTMFIKIIVDTMDV
jgi:TNF receptor-associated factor 2